MPARTECRWPAHSRWPPACRHRAPAPPHRHRRRFLGEVDAHALARRIDRASRNHAVGPGEVDIFEQARPLRHLAGRLAGIDGNRAIGLDFADDHFAILDVADILGPDHVERAGLRAEDRLAVEFAHHQRADPHRVARRDQLGAGDGEHGIAAFHLPNGVDEAVGGRAVARAGDEVQHHLGVRGRLADRAGGDDLAAQRQPIGEIAVVGNGDAAGFEFGEQRLHIAQRHFARGRIARVAHGDGAGKAGEQGRVGIVVAHQAHALFLVELAAIEAHDAGRFLSPVLQGVQPQRRQGGSIRMPQYSEHAAFLMQGIPFEVEVVVARLGQGRLHEHPSGPMAKATRPPGRRSRQ